MINFKKKNVSATPKNNPRFGDGDDDAVVWRGGEAIADTLAVTIIVFITSSSSSSDCTNINGWDAGAGSVWTRRQEDEEG